MKEKTGRKSRQVKAVKNIPAKAVEGEAAKRVKGGFLKKLPGKRTPPTITLGRG